MAARISKETDTPIKDVYKIMGMLSQYSSYKSLKNIKEIFYKNNITVVSNLTPFYTNDDINFSPCLTNVLHYIGLKNFNFPKDSPHFTYVHKALFIDSDLINIINNLPKDEKDRLYKNVFEKENIIPIYIENFENGYNFLNQEKSFETFTTDFLIKAKIKSQKENTNLKNSAKNLLNEKNYKDIEKLGIDAKIIKFNLPNTPEQIAENLNPVIPSRNELLGSIEQIAENNLINNFEEEYREMFKYNYNISAEDYYKKVDKIEYEQYKTNIAKILNQSAIIISPHQYCKYMKDLHKKINEFVENHGKSKENIYYLIPSKNKSFVLTNYEYQKINGIKNPKNIYINGSHFDYKNLKNKLPANSTLVILDDCSISGLSYTTQMFNYESISNFIPKEKNVSIVFAPILMTKYAENAINKVMKENKRFNLDTIIYEKTIPNLVESNNYNDIFKNSSEKSNIYSTIIAFPYMGPDSNSEKFLPLCEKFL